MGEVDLESAAVELDVVHVFGGIVGILLVLVCDKSKTTRPALVSGDVDISDWAELFKLVSQIALASSEVEVTDVELALLISNSAGSAATSPGRS